MPDRLVYDADHPQGHLVPMTADEEAARTADAQAEATRQAARDAAAARERAVRDDLAGLLVKIEAGTATAAEQRRALARAIRLLTGQLD